MQGKMDKMSERDRFFCYVIPSVLSFALSGIYAIVDGFFVGNSIGDSGLSAINIAYPIVAVLQALGTGIGMGGAIYYSISMAQEKEQKARRFIAGSLWLLLLTSVVLTAVIYLSATPLLGLLGARGELMALGEAYITVIALGAMPQIFGTGLVPFIRNHGGPFYAMIAMGAGFITNIFLDCQFVWVMELGIKGAAWATVIGQGVTMLTAVFYLLRKKQIVMKISLEEAVYTARSVVKIGIAPFGLTMTPNITLMIVDRFSMAYGGEKAVAVYACIAYIVCIVYLMLQGVGDGSQPLMSRYHGEKKPDMLKDTQKAAYGTALFLSIASGFLMFVVRDSIGPLFGASEEVSRKIGQIIPIFLVALPFVAVNRITTACFYATEKDKVSYILTYIEPALMLVLMLLLPPFLGGQVMIWWSTVLAGVLAAVLSVGLKWVYG